MRRQADRMAMKWRAESVAARDPPGPGPRALKSHDLKRHIFFKSFDATAISGNRELSSTSSLPLIQDGIPDCHGIDVIKR